MQKGFKEKYKWWAAIELGRRVLLLLFIVPFPGNEVGVAFYIHSYGSHRCAYITHL